MSLKRTLLSSAGTLAVLIASVAVSRAEDPAIYRYTHVGTPAPTSVFTATTTGAINGTFIGSGAGAIDTVRIFDQTTGVYGPWSLNNTALAGDVFSLGSFNQGDVLSFQIQNLGLSDPAYAYMLGGVSPANYVMSSNPALSTDGANHAFSTSALGGLTYVAMEDLPALYSDFNYYDYVFYASNVTASPVAAATPEPASLALLGTGMLGVVGVLHRKLSV